MPETLNALGRFITCSQLRDCMNSGDGILVLDVRPAEIFIQGHLKGKFRDDNSGVLNIEPAWLMQPK